MTPTAPPARGADDITRHLTIKDGAIHFFMYMQDGSKMPWRLADTLSNRHFVNWLQVHDSPTTGSDVETVARRGQP